MSRKRLLLVVGVLTAVAGAAYLSQDTAPSAGAQMTEAAARFLAGLDPKQKAKAAFSFDDNERTNWHFVPMQDTARRPTRKGLPLEEMTGEQKKQAHALLKAGTSPDGYRKAVTIMGLEAILNELEKGGAMVRNPEWYFFSIFGTPARTGRWGWRVEGHHLSLNYVVENGQLVAATPCFFGANPAVVITGPRRGTRTLPEAEALAVELFADLDEAQRKAAYQDKQLPEIEQGKAVPHVGAAVGLPVGRLHDRQRVLLYNLIRSYATRLPAEMARRLLLDLQKSGFEKVHFAFARANDKPGKPTTYRIQGSTFVIEFLNVQADSARRPANHIHSVWRNVRGDFGLARKD